MGYKLSQANGERIIMIYAVTYEFETRIDPQLPQNICATAHLLLPLDSLVK